MIKRQQCAKREGKGKDISGIQAYDVKY